MADITKELAGVQMKNRDLEFRLRRLEDKLASLEDDNKLERSIFNASFEELEEKVEELEEAITDPCSSSCKEDTPPKKKKASNKAKHDFKPEDVKFLRKLLPILRENFN